MPHTTFLQLLKQSSLSLRIPSRLAASLACIFVSTLSVATSHATTHADIPIQENGIAADINTDFSGHRVDSQIAGWNEDYTELSVMALETRRGPRGTQRGEVFMLVFNIGAIKPKHNHHALYISQAPTPHDPLPLTEIRDRMWGMGFRLKARYFRAPKDTPPKGGIDYRMLWEPIITPNSDRSRTCSPSVGFILWKGKAIRYQAHQTIDMAGPCADLRFTNIRRYWADKPGLGAAVIRFDKSPNSQEDSVRYPFSVAWDQAQPIRFWLSHHASDPNLALSQRLAERRLRTYGKVYRGNGEAWAQGGQHAALRDQKSIGVFANPSLRALAYDVARALNLPSIFIPELPDGQIWVRAAPATSPVQDLAAFQGPSKQPSAGLAPKRPLPSDDAFSDNASKSDAFDNSALDAPAGNESSSEFLDDWKIP